MGFIQPLVHEELSERVIGCAMTVINRLRCGLPEKVYENALAIELRKVGHQVDSQKEFPIHYDGIPIGKLIPDLLIDDLIIVDTKVVSNFADEHIAKMLGYLAVTGLELAILINFRYPRLRWKRVVRQQID
jgi:GxxExxY protein